MALAVLCAVVLWGPAFPARADPSAIARDDFETGSHSGGSGWASNWNVSSAVGVVAAESPHSGVRHLEMRGHAAATRMVELTGWTKVELEFWAKARSLEGADLVTAEVSPDGKTWEVLETWADGDDQNEYYLYQYDLSGMAVPETFFLRFVSRMDESSDYFYIDDVLLQGERILESQPPLSSPPRAEGDSPGFILPVSRVVSTSAASAGGGIAIDGAFSDWAGYPNLSDPRGDASKVRGDLSAFYWGNNGGAEVNYWMIERYSGQGIDDGEEDEDERDDDEREDEDEDGGDGRGDASSKLVKYTIYVDTDNDGDFSGRDDRRVQIDYHPKWGRSDVRVRVQAGRGGRTFAFDRGDWGEPIESGGRRVEVGVPWSDLGITSGDVIRMYVESNWNDRLPDSGDIQWSPASILGAWLLGALVAAGAVGLWYIRKRKELACLSGPE